MRIWFPYLATGGGGELFVHRLGHGLESRGHEVLRTPLSSYLQYFPWAARAIHAPVSIDVTVAGTPAAFALPRREGKLVVVEFHSVLDPELARYRGAGLRLLDQSTYRRFAARSCTVADAVVVTSESTARSLATGLGVEGATVVYPGIDTDFFQPPPYLRTHTKEGPTRLLYVGNLTSRKGADLLPHILRRLGEGYQLRYTSGLRTARRLEHHDSAIPLGRLSKESLLEEYQQADLLLFPSRFEGFGFVVAEAMACGLPVVTTACSSLPELVEDGITGRLCPVGDCDAYAAAVAELAGDPEMRRRMGERARQVATERFRLDAMASAFEALFLELLGSARSG